MTGSGLTLGLLQFLEVALSSLSDEVPRLGLVGQLEEVLFVDLVYSQGFESFQVSTLRLHCESRELEAFGLDLVACCVDLGKGYFGLGVVRSVLLLDCVGSDGAGGFALAKTLIVVQEGVVQVPAGCVMRGEQLFQLVIGVLSERGSTFLSLASFLRLRCCNVRASLRMQFYSSSSRRMSSSVFSFTVILLQSN